MPDAQPNTTFTFNLGLGLANMSALTSETPVAGFGWLGIHANHSADEGPTTEPPNPHVAFLNK